MSGKEAPAERSAAAFEGVQLTSAACGNYRAVSVSGRMKECAGSRESPLWVAALRVERVEISSVSCDEDFVVGDNRLHSRSQSFIIKVSSPGETKRRAHVEVDIAGVLGVSMQHWPIGSSGKRKQSNEAEHKFHIKSAIILVEEKSVQCGSISPKTAMKPLS